MFQEASVFYCLSGWSSFWSSTPLSVCVSAAVGAAMAFSWWVADAHLYRAGKIHEEPIFVFFQQWDSVPPAQAAGVRPLQDHALLAGGRSVCWRGGCDLHDSQPAQCRYSGLLHELLVSDATGVSAQHPGSPDRAESPTSSCLCTTLILENPIVWIWKPIGKVILFGINRNLFHL